MPGEKRVFTTRVEPVSPPYRPPLEKGRELVEAPGTAPGSTTLMPRTVYRHSRQADDRNIGHPKPNCKEFARP
jgi:hypothetical protein